MPVLLLRFAVGEPVLRSDDPLRSGSIIISGAAGAKA
jgi:hypothetical protein